MYGVPEGLRDKLSQNQTIAVVESTALLCFIGH